MMSNRPPDPKNARNKNVLVVGGSGSGKTRFFIKPNLLQCDSKAFPVSFVVTDPKGSIVVECGNALLKNGYKVRILNTINFKKSMHYNPFAYVHSEKDILKLVTTLMTNTKGEGSGGDPFWEKSERLLLTALIAYLHYEAPVEEQKLMNSREVKKMKSTFCVWTEDGVVWHCNPMAGEDASKDLLSMIDGNPQTYVEYGKWFYPADLPLEVVRQLADGVPVTKEMIVALNPKRSEWDEIKAELDEIGYLNKL